MASRTQHPTRARQPASEASAHVTAAPVDQASRDEHPLLALQRAVGNRAVQRLLRDATAIRRQLGRFRHGDGARGSRSRQRRRPGYGGRPARWLDRRRHRQQEPECQGCRDRQDAARPAPGHDRREPVAQPRRRD